MTTTDDLTGPTGDQEPAEEELPSEVPAGSVRLPFGRNPRHFGIDPDEPWPDDVPMDQDDTHWRFEDDPKGARRAELRIGACWTVTLLASIAVCAVYVDGANNQLAGLCYGLAFGGLGIGLILWARDLLPGHEVTASRGHHEVSHDDYRVAVAESFGRGTDAIARRPFVFKILAPAGLLLGLGVLFGPIASLGPRPDDDLYKTRWGRFTRALDQDGNPIRPGDLPPKAILTVFPEGGMNDALSPTLLINLGDADFKANPNRPGWNLVGPYGNIVAFSKICTHAACPASLYNVQTNQLICPCHQSTFNVLEACKPVFGPAPRSLAQLQLATDGEGYIVSVSDYTKTGGGPVGPGFWNRG
jgi:quinol---cytochrome c reductase iron-sulfur subunit